QPFTTLRPFFFKVAKSRPVLSRIESVNRISRPSAAIRDARLYWRQALPPYASAIGEHTFAAFRRVTIQKTMLTLPSNFRRLILSFHRSNLELWKQSTRRSG